MQLIIDIGNTRTKFALFKEQTFLFLETGDIDTLGSILKEKNISSAIISAVKPSEDYERKLKSFNIPTVYLSHKTPIPITNNYGTPKTLGDDRLANVIGANYLFPNKHVLAIDCGTCIKFDLISKTKIYTGGAISLGLNMRFHALYNQTAQLPPLEIESIDYLIGQSTKESILSGVMNGTLAEIDGVVKRYQALYDNLTVIITGGDAKYFENDLNCNIFAKPNLTLIGLNEILLFNIA